MRSFALMLIIPFTASLVSGCGEASSTSPSTNTTAPGPETAPEQAKGKPNPAKRTP